jgi:hypothetical protein
MIERCGVSRDSMLTAGLAGGAAAFTGIIKVYLHEFISFCLFV